MPEKAEPFNWIIKGKLAASWWPDDMLFKKYQEENITVIINCSEFDNRNDIPKDFKYYHLNVSDFGIPSTVQIERFIQITKDYKGESIVVHCVAGCGRTAQFIVAWAAFNGYIPKSMNPVKWIRNLRPCSLETKEQLENARKLAKKYQK
jgi:protein-tyrosine phosphatase